MPNSLNLQIEKIPSSSGIYKYFNKNGDIIYIGKSVHLKNRVKSYFNGKSKLNFAKKKMVSEITHIEYILTNNETESLVLEHTLVKKHQPKYNILLKDDKNYLYIKITNEPIARIITTRQKTDSQNIFGPYLSGHHVKNILKVVKKVFGYRSCKINFENTGNIWKISGGGQIKIPCIDYYIKRCSGPCLLDKKNIEEYKNGIQAIKNVLKGNYKDLVDILQEQMQQYAKNLEFEKAQEYKQDILSLQSLDETQTVRDFVEGEYNIINIIKKYDKFFVGIIEIRDSKIVGYKNLEVENKLDESEEEILAYILIQQELSEQVKDMQYIIPREINNFLPEYLQKKVEIPKIGGKLDMLKLCYKNIYEYAYKKHISSLSVKSGSKSTQKSLLELLGYEVKNQDIIFECNDISHISGSHTVASRSVIHNGKPDTSLYRKYNIKTLENTQINDFASLSEVISRRLEELIYKKNLPDLIIIDGGKGQLGSVMQILESYKMQYQQDSEILDLLSSIQLCSLAKKQEEIFLPYKQKPVILKKDSQELQLIQKIRDEAHRFAITFNRQKRSKTNTKNILESLPGFGPKTRKKLLEKFGSVSNLNHQEASELKKILTKKQVETLQDHGIIE